MYSTASQCNRKFKLGRIVPIASPGLWLCVRYFSRKKNLTERPGIVAKAVMVGPAYRTTRYHFATQWFLVGQAERLQTRHKGENTYKLIAEIADSNVLQLTETG